MENVIENFEKLIFIMVFIDMKFFFVVYLYWIMLKKMGIVVCCSFEKNCKCIVWYELFFLNKFNLSFEREEREYGKIEKCF